MVNDGNVNDYALFANDLIYYYKDSGDNRADGIWTVDENSSNVKQIIVTENSNDIYQPLFANNNYIVYLVKCRDNYDSENFHNQINVYDLEKEKVIYEGDDLKERITFLGLTE